MFFSFILYNFFFFNALKPSILLSSVYVCICMYSTLLFLICINGSHCRCVFSSGGMNCRKKWKFLQQQLQYPADGREGSAVCSVGFQLRDQHVTVIFANYEGT